MANRLSVKTIFPALLDHLERNVPYKELQLKHFRQLVKTSCFTVKNIIESPAFKVLEMALVYLSIVTVWFQEISTTEGRV